MRFIALTMRNRIQATNNASIRVNQVANFNGAAEVGNFEFLEASARYQWVEEWHQEVFGDGVNDSCELLPHDECNGDAQSVALGEKELNKFSALALKYGLNMNVF